MKILDIFPYFNEVELLELRINLLRGKVDEFIICDANFTFSGVPKEFGALKAVQKLGLTDKITIIETDLTPLQDKAPVDRERAQRNAATKFITPGKIAIVTDCDEIMDPTFVDYYCQVALANPQVVIHIPMPLLHGRADLRLNKYGIPIVWQSGFICLPHHLEKYTLSDIREAESYKIPIDYEGRVPVDNGQVEMAGWHFSWMGDATTIYNASTHSTDYVEDNISTYTDQSILSFLESYIPQVGATDALGRHSHSLSAYDTKLLPPKLFTLPGVLQFLLPPLHQHIYEDSCFGEDWFTFPGLYKKMVTEFPSGSTFVEVGVWKGKSAAYMCVELARSEKDIRFYCVDSWEDPEIYHTFVTNMKPVEVYYTPIRVSSLEASKGFANKSLDFVFLDSDHSYDAMIQELLAWMPKIKLGGILAGHDYYPDHPEYCGVYAAVNTLFNSKDIESSENCFIIRDPTMAFAMNKLTGAFTTACTVPSDINEHLSYLYGLAKRCDSVVELGVRDGKSTTAFLLAGIKLRSYDLEIDPNVTDLFKEASGIGQDVQYIQGNTWDITIDACDLLFIDTLHTYTQLKRELQLHGNFASRYIVFHDIQSYGAIGEDGKPGLMGAILEFIRDNQWWTVKEVFTNNNGLLVLTRFGVE